MSTARTRLLITTIWEIVVLLVITAVSLLAAFWVMTSVMRLPSITAMIIVVPSSLVCAAAGLYGYKKSWRARHVESRGFQPELLKHAFQLLGVACIPVRIPRSHIRRMSTVSVVITALIAYALGARWTLPIAIALGLLPVSMFVSLIGRIFMPPPLEITEE